MSASPPNKSPLGATPTPRNALLDSSLVDPLDTSAGVSSDNNRGMDNSSDAIFAWRDRQARKQSIKKEQRETTSFAPPPPFVFSPNIDSRTLAVGTTDMGPPQNAAPALTPNIQGILDTIRHRRRSSAASMRSDVWKHDQSALDTASLASEEIHVSKGLLSEVLSALPSWNVLIRFQRLLSSHQTFIPLTSPTLRFRNSTISVHHQSICLPLSRRIITKKTTTAQRHLHPGWR